MTQPTFNDYPAAREEAKRLTRYWGHTPGRFVQAHLISGGYSTLCRKCQARIGAMPGNNHLWMTYGKGTQEQCPITG